MKKPKRIARKHPIHSEDSDQEKNTTNFMLVVFNFGLHTYDRHSDQYHQLHVGGLLVSTYLGPARDYFCALVVHPSDLKLSSVVGVLLLDARPKLKHHQHVVGGISAYGGRGV